LFLQINSHRAVNTTLLGNNKTDKVNTT